MSNFKIFGSEPAAIVGVVEAVLGVALAFGLFGVTPEAAMAITGVVAAGLGLVVAYATRRAVLSAMTGLVKAAILLVTAFGVTVTEGQSAAIVAAVTLVGGVVLRQMNVSVESAVSRPSKGAHTLAA